MERYIQEGKIRLDGRIITKEDMEFIPKGKNNNRPLIQVEYENGEIEEYFY